MRVARTATRRSTWTGNGMNFQKIVDVSKEKKKGKIIPSKTHTESNAGCD